MAYVSGAPRDPTAVVGRRITAYLLDGLLVSVALAVVLSMAKHDTFADAPANACSILRARHADDSSAVMCVGVASRAWLWKRSDFLIAVDVAALVGILNLVVLQAVTGASLGKHVLGLRVVDEQGQPAGFGRTIARWLLLVVDGAIFLVGLIAVLTTRFHRRIGDLAAGTYVVGKASAGRPIGYAPPAIPYGGPVFAAPAVGPTPVPGLPPAPPAPLAPGWGVTQPSAPLASSMWSAPPPAPPPRTYTPPAPPPTPPAPPAAQPTPPAPPAAPPAPPPAAPPPAAPPRTYTPPEPSAPPKPASLPRTYTPPEPSAPPPAPPRVPSAPAHTALPKSKPPERQTVPQPESWWDTAVPNDPADGEEQP